MHWLFATPLKRFVLLAAGASLLLNLTLLAPALYMLQVFDRVFGSRSVETLVMLSLIVVLALCVNYCMDTARAHTLAWIGRTIERQLSPAVMQQALNGDTAAGAESSMDRLRDIRVLRSFLGSSGVQALFDAPWLPLFLMLIALMHPALGLAAVLGAVALATLAVATERLTRAGTAVSVEESRNLGRLANSLARHSELIASMGMGAAALVGWQSQHDKVLDAQARLFAITSRLAALARVLRQAVQVAVLGLGAWLVVGAEASPGIMVAATILLGRALQPVEHLISGWKQLLDARGAWQRLNQPDFAAPPLSQSGLPAPAGRLQLERVVYGADASRAALIKGVSFALEPGESLGIVGPSAAGKTTLLQLMLGLRQARSGAVRLDGVDVAQWKREELGGHLGYLPQDVSLLAGTVAHNIARLGPVDSARVVEAAQRAQVHEMILRLPQGYETLVGDGGAVLSGGQRQRIGLARALYGAPALVLLDEPNAHLDAEGEAALKTALQGLKERGTTVVMVGHKPSLMAQLDKLAVLNDGALEAFGPTNAVLARLAGAQARPVQVLQGAVAKEVAA